MENTDIAVTVNQQEEKSPVKTKSIGDTVTASEIIASMVNLSADSKKPLTWADAHEALNLFKEAVIQEISHGYRVQINGFVSFVPAYRPPRKGNNVITNEPMDIPEGIQITAKAGSLLRKALKNLGSEAIPKFKALRKKTPQQ